ncbi:MAG: hypothetical protein AB7K04_12000 [Pseudorhodoplanes sp.]
MAGKELGITNVAPSTETTEVAKETTAGPIIFGMAAAALSGAIVGFFVAGRVAPALLFTAGIIAGALMAWYARGFVSAK